MSKRLIVFAQRAEAAATLDTLKAEPVPESTRAIWSEGTIPSCYRFAGGWIVLSSVGIQAAQMAVATYAPQVDEVWNLGMAGALRDQLPIGETVMINHIGKYVPSGLLDAYSQECVDTTLPHLSIDYGTHKLISSDFPIHDLNHRQHLSQKWDLVDMEGYGVAYAAHHLGKKCRMWKIISDFASPGGRALIRKNKAQLSEHLAKIVYESCAHP